jgi:hypothetical protein
MPDGDGAPEPEHDPDTPAAAQVEGERYYRGTIARVYYGSETGVIRSDATGREYRFKWPLVEIRGPIPRVNGLREGMSVGFDVAWTSSGLIVSVIQV